MSVQRMHNYDLLNQKRCCLYTVEHESDLVRVENLQEGFVDVGLALEAVLDLVDVVDGMVELHGLVVLHGWASGGPTEGRVELHGRGARGGVHWDGQICLAAGR